MARLNITNIVVSIVYAMMIVVFFLFEPPFGGSIDYDTLKISLYFFLLAFIIHLIHENQENWFRLDILFLFGFAIVHLQWPMMLAISDIEPERFRVLSLNSIYITYGTWLSTMGILFWFLGVSLLPKMKYSNIEKYKINYSYILWLTALLFIFFLLTVGSGFFSGSVYKGEGGSASGEGISGYIQLFFGISLTILTILVLINEKEAYKKNTFKFLVSLDKVFLIIAVSYIFIFLAAGDRGGPMQFMMVFFMVIGSLIRPIKFKEFTLIILVGAIVLTAIGSGRSSDSKDNILVAGVNSIDFSSNYDFSINMANSARTLYIALDHVPKEHDYFAGRLWVGAILGMVPFAQNAYLNITETPRHEISSPEYITYVRYGKNASSGEGTTVIADIYLNFGTYGVMLTMLLLGLFFKKLQNELNIQKNIYWIIVAISLGGLAFYMGRGMLLSSYRTMVWSLILLIIFVKFEQGEKK